MHRRVLFILFFTFSVSFGSKGQDFHFSQFYSSPLNLNPALAGVSEKTRLGINYRKQWPGLNYDFTAYSAFIDHFSFDLNSGFGLVINSFNEQHLNLNTSEVGGFYSYRVTLSENTQLRLGNQTSFVTKRGELSYLLFGDQIDPISGTTRIFSDDYLAQIEPYNYLDISFGLLLNGENYWLGISGHHLNRPKIWHESLSGADFIPAKIAIHGGLEFDFPSFSNFQGDKNNYLVVMGSFKKQSNFNQIDINLQAIYNTFNFGVGYRGMPNTAGIPTIHTLIFISGFTLESGVILGYSYDWELSRFVKSTLGSHEFSLRYQFYAGNPKNRNKKRTVLKCFDYIF